MSGQPLSEERNWHPVPIRYCLNVHGDMLCDGPQGHYGGCTFTGSWVLARKLEDEVLSLGSYAGDTTNELREARAEIDRLRAKVARLDAAFENVIKDNNRLEAELARTPVRLTAEEAEKVKDALYFKPDGWDEALALLTPAGKDETKVCTDCGRDLHGYKSYARARGLCRYCDGTAE